MSRRITICLSHAIEEENQLRLLTDLGHEVFSVGGYITPSSPHDPKRPPLDLPSYPELKAAVDAIGSDDNLGAAQSSLPKEILAWSDTLIYHHYLGRLFGQWDQIRDWLRGDPNRRVIWRSVGQSVEGNEVEAAPFRKEGLERVAYSPKEALIPSYSGHDALIRFYADPAEWSGWTGDHAVVVNVTQHLRQRDPYTNWGFWQQATRGLNALPLGPGSDAIWGPGELPYDDMREWLRRARAYCYTGTQPASYTLGLIEAMMTGIPVVSIGPSHMRVFPYGPALFEGHEITGLWADDPKVAHDILDNLLLYPDFAKEHSERQRARAIELFGYATIKEQWRDFLG